MVPDPRAERIAGDRPCPPEWGVCEGDTHHRFAPPAGRHRIAAPSADSHDKDARLALCAWGHDLLAR